VSKDWFAYLDARTAPCPMSGCWLWTGRAQKYGYGGVTKDGKQTQAHRVAYELHKGPIPAGHVVRHRCDNPACVNPDHLVVGTVQDNATDMVSRGRSRKWHTQASRKLSPQCVQAIRDLAQQGVQCARLAMVYGVTDTTIRNVVARRKWKGV
jgi:hypothetical protein